MTRQRSGRAAAATAPGPATAPRLPKERGRHAAEHTGFFCSQEEAAVLLGMSPNALSDARARGELQGLFTLIGRRVCWHRPGLLLKAMGIDSPAGLGAFVRAAGVGSLRELIDFLDDEGGAS